MGPARVGREVEGVLRVRWAWHGGQRGGIGTVLRMTEWSIWDSL